MTSSTPLAPEWDTTKWFNTERPFLLSSLHRRVVVAAAFQMFCPSCVAQTIPQMQQVHAIFPAEEVAVVGLHTVFEHYGVMGPAALALFLHEYRVTFPVGVDRPGEAGDPLPVTMRRYGVGGTPTLLLIDRQGRLRRQTLGHVRHLQLGAEIMSLTRESVDIARHAGDIPE